MTGTTPATENFRATPFGSGSLVREVLSCQINVDQAFHAEATEGSGVMLRCQRPWEK